MSDYLIDDPVGGRFSVRRRVLIEPDVFTAERRAIFDRLWLYVGHESELAAPNDYKTRSVGGRPVIFARDKQRQLRVWINSCPHRGATLCREREGNARFLTCMYHGWSFATSGSVVSMPGDDAYGEGFQRRDLVPAPRIAAYQGFVFVNFDSEAPELASYLDQAAGYLHRIATRAPRVTDAPQECELRANWKLLVENGLDAYHGRLTSGRSGPASRLAAPDSPDRGSSASALGHGHAVCVTPAPMTEHGAGDDDSMRQRPIAWTHLLIFPNLLIIDQGDDVVVRKIDPLAPDRVRVEAWKLTSASDDRAARSQLSTDLLTFCGPGGRPGPDDSDLLENTQRGCAAGGLAAWSDFSRGMGQANPSALDEAQHRVWWRQWDQLLDARE